ncbi:unnamed protein product [Pieris brassicae]|uniref:Uncharacterized protein n=1 Tax=Pieris brassicae TaxID=7116 RepID=A0A9P0XGH4_PIEBR|nr:unnamed protein product [Pieris brassicae]
MYSECPKVYTSKNAIVPSKRRTEEDKLSTSSCRILPSESGASVQYVGDNADINVSTLAGNNTLHLMGMIKIVTLKDALIYDDRIKKYTTKPSAKELAAISHLSLLAYEKPVLPVYSKIQVQNLHDDQLVKDLEPLEWGWMLENEILELIRTLLPPANIIFSNCKNVYPSNPDEESAYDLEILEDLEMNMADNEDDANELNIFDDDEEEEDN